MDLRPLEDGYAVSPQIEPDDVPAIAAQGYTVVVCNRPDEEVPLELSAAVIRAAVEAAGLVFVDNPVTHATLTPERVAVQAEAMGRGRTFAYCASGNRSSVLWSLARAPALGADAVIEAAARAGYDQRALRPRLGG